MNGKSGALRGVRVLRAIAEGVGAALGAPLLVHGRRFERLLDRGVAPDDASETASEIASAGTVAPHAGGPHDVIPGDVVVAMRAARGGLRYLASVPLSPWRNTCLYRSIAECLVLHRYDIPATIRLGVRNEAPPHGPIVAHAWVIYPGAVPHVTHAPLASTTRG
jgi:hypothetical protein